MTDRDLAQAADAAFRKTTITYASWMKNVRAGKYPALGGPSQFGIGFGLLEQIGVASPPPPPSPSGYPASYTTGPLGTSNILPKKTGSLLIEHYGGGGVSWADPGDARSFVKMIPQRETAIGRKFDCIHIGYWGGGEVTLPDGSKLFGLFDHELAENRIQWVHDRGQQPLISWSPDYSIADVNAGKADAVFAYMADYLKQFAYPIMLRLWWEFDNTGGFPWAVGGSANIGAPFVAAWKRVVGIFKAHAANNVGFWWCPLEGSPDRVGINASYPGDAYVDWVGSDVYNGCYVGETGCWSSPVHSGWATFEEAALYGLSSQYTLWSPKKPFVIGELGCVYDPNAPASLKGDWYRAIPAVLQAKAPLLCGLSFFDQDVSGFEGGKANWRVDYPVSNPDCMAGFKQMAGDPWLNTNS